MNDNLLKLFHNSDLSTVFLLEQFLRPLLYSTNIGRLLPSFGPQTSAVRGEVPRVRRGVSRSAAVLEGRFLLWQMISGFTCFHTSLVEVPDGAV